MTKSVKTETAPAQIRADAIALSNKKVGNMTAQIVKAFTARDKFEAANGVDITANNSYTRERDRMLREKQSVARLFTVLGVTASNVINRKVSANAMFNAKALKKVTEIACFVTGNAQDKRNLSLEKVTQAFIACALIASDNKMTAIQNPINKRFLSSTKLDEFISDETLRNSLADMRHKAMTEGRDTQSSQARNVLDVLGLGTISSVDKHRDAITLEVKHAFFDLFRGRYMTKAA